MKSLLHGKWQNLYLDLFASKSFDHLFQDTYDQNKNTFADFATFTNAISYFFGPIVLSIKYICDDVYETYTPK